MFGLAEDRNGVSIIPPPTQDPMSHSVTSMPRDNFGNKDIAIFNPIHLTKLWNDVNFPTQGHHLNSSLISLASTIIPNAFYQMKY